MSVIHGEAILMDQVRVHCMIRYTALGCIPFWEVRSRIVDCVLRVKKITAGESKLLACFLSKGEG